MCSLKGRDDASIPVVRGTKGPQPTVVSWLLTRKNQTQASIEFKVKESLLMKDWDREKVTP